MKEFMGKKISLILPLILLLVSSCVESMDQENKQTKYYSSGRLEIEEEILKTDSGYINHGLYKDY